ncbi:MULTISPECIES: 3-oxoacyl-[acyl-carrier-protein] synthase III C-terminal domain-containing protein [unclassified Frigoribacterium]|uniref:3-oxoacyl-[acyl-carrier-protein] synthase III C-terminal domain-containing protein n=1 Tax=unclassified Frigoribacterium TaxID=2627005 RepID=UPI0006F744F7|nr:MULTISPECIES: 3-oxoacyl-[acyl-carrier-protein] synthase III C-terminal domain-containing protein [unclassified Frigoribacterium]KQO47610.1 3-oxoacyl-ACP synthase [Frigoribacterium sp. Leaf254]KQT39703.1 3-oxoacyl-ACP synthase [Frigoribacterium sp. Leaf415]
MKNCQIAGWGTYLPDEVVAFGAQTRYRVADHTSQLDMLASAAEQALERAGLRPDDVECVIAACAAGVQPIPCTAALVMERVAPGAAAAAFDVNSTCTSFVTAVDVASRYLADGEYDNVLIVSGDVGSRFLDPGQRESFELFSDAAAAVVLTRGADDPEGPGVIASLQRTWPAHAHDTELRGGLSRHPAQAYADGDPRDYLFDMNGRRALMGMLAVLPGFFAAFFEKAGLGLDDVDLVVPHQASGALGIAMRRLGMAPGTYVDAVAEYGNMVSASVPYTLARCLDDGRLGRGDTVLLCGTAAGLTANALALRL